MRGIAIKIKTLFSHAYRESDAERAVSAAARRSAPGETILNGSTFDSSKPPKVASSLESGSAYSFHASSSSSPSRPVSLPYRSSSSAYRGAAAAAEARIAP